MRISKKIRKELIEWVLFFGVLGFLYFSGLYVEVAGFAQRVILSTGIIQPDINIPESGYLKDYDFKLKSIDTDNVINFDTYKGKLVFVNFWATWCAPCRAEMPSIHDLYDKYKNKDIEFVMISSENDKQKISRYIENKDFEFPVFQLVSSIPQKLNSNSIPTTFVIDRNGKIILINHGMANYNTSNFRKFLDSHLKN